MSFSKQYTAWERVKILLPEKKIEATFGERINDRKEGYKKKERSMLMCGIFHLCDFPTGINWLQQNDSL